MTAYQTEGRVCRKSSVYNQTGETYFQQLSAYNHMSAHLRRVLLAPCVVESRNKRYTKNRGLGGGRSSRSKSLDKTRMREDIIDGVAYDTEHHPLEVLRMNLECSRDCRQRVKRVVDVCKRCNDWSARSRAGLSAGSVAQPAAFRGKFGPVCSCSGSPGCKFGSTAAAAAAAPKRGSGKLAKSSSSRRRLVVPLSSSLGQSGRSVRDESRTKAKPSSSQVDRIEASYSYDSSFESSSEASSTPGSPILKKPASSRGSRAESLDAAAEVDEPIDERSEEAKYAKFVYEVTQDIMANGLYTDDELRAIFRKHVDLNSGTLDRNRMQSEINELKMSLNLPEHSDDESEAVFHGEANPELLITERDVLLTLTEMKLDPRQIRSICKSLHEKSSDRMVVRPPVGGPGSTETCQCICRQSKVHNLDQSQTKMRSEMGIQASLIDSKGDGSRTTTRSRSSDRMSEASSRPRSIASSEFKKIYEVPETVDWRGKQEKSSMKNIVGSEGTFPENSGGLSVERRTTGSEDSGEEKSYTRIIRSSVMSQLVKSSDDDVSVKSENQSEEELDKSEIPKIQLKKSSESRRDEKKAEEEPRISFVSHSEFLKNLKRDDNSLPDISERSDEIVTIGSQTTPRRSQVDEAENTLHVEVESVAKESRVDVAEAEEAKSEAKSSINEESEDLESDEDSDENKQVVVASLESLLSPGIATKISRLSPDADKEEDLVAEESIISIESTPRISENLDKSEGQIDEPSKSEANDDDQRVEDVGKQSGDKNSLKVEREEADDTLSIETETDQPEISSTSEMHRKSPKADDDEEAEKSHEFSDQWDDRPTSINETSKSAMGILYTDSGQSMKSLQEEKPENPENQKKKSTSRRLSRLLGMGSRSRSSVKSQEAERQKIFGDAITTASDISFLRKQNFSDSASSIGTVVETPKESSKNFESSPENSQRRGGGSSISKKMKAAMEHLMKRSSSGKSAELRDETTQISPGNSPSMTTTGTQGSSVALPLKDSQLPSEIIKTQNSTCLCILASAPVESIRNRNCRADCRGREFVCDHRCSALHRSLL